MKTTATILLGIFCLFSAVSCRCNLEEDEPKAKYKSPDVENDTITLKK
ncbi:hypothetical protein PFY10_03080 [Chryseobacterium daecheongense]|nr:hypothetical protein PFY10_03080 [Chryseobacterium daecheongense]